MSMTEHMHPGEEILYTMKPSRFVHFWWYVVGIFLSWALIGILIIVIVELLRKGNTYYITSDRVVHEFTFVSRKISSSPYSRVQDIHLTQSLPERIAKIGTVHINTAGTNSIEIEFKGVDDPHNVKKAIEAHMIRKHS